VRARAASPGSFARTLGSILHEAELFRVRMPLVEPFRTATGETEAKEALLVCVRGDAGEGWGECAAFTTPAYAPDTIDTARLVLRDYLLPPLLARVPMPAIRGHGAARAALECALLDGRLRRDGVSLAAHLGAARSHVDAGVAIGFCDDEARFGALLGSYVEAGYRRVKCKIEPGRDRAVLHAARGTVGDGFPLAADANGSYTLADAATLATFDPFDLQCLEQPLGADALADHAALASRIRSPLCLDESVTSATVARDAITCGAAQVVSIKPARLGIAEARAVHDVCVAAGVPAVAGGMLETGIGRAVLVALSALPGFTMTGDCSASDRYFGPDGDLTDPFVLEDGRLAVPGGPGLGVTVRPEQLARFTVARERILAEDM
jgi:O-succinylbenzoate synthase